MNAAAWIAGSIHHPSRRSVVPNGCDVPKDREFVPPSEECRIVYAGQLYPWKGSGLNGSLGFYQGNWGVDFYFDVSSSVQPYTLVGAQQPTNSLNVTSGLLLRAKF